MNTLKDKVILIVGAGGNVAGALEGALRREGARLVLADKDIVRIKGRSSSYDAFALEADFATLQGARDAVATIKAEMGHLDGLIHLIGEVLTGPTGDLDETAYERTFDSNMRTLFNATSAALSALLERDEAFIGGVGAPGAPGTGKDWTLFTAAKSAAGAYLRALDAELAGTGVSVAAVLPQGPLDTLANRRRFEGSATTFIHPRALADAFVRAALSDDTGRLLELPIHPPRRKGTS